MVRATLAPSGAGAELQHPADLAVAEAPCRRRGGRAWVERRDAHGVLAERVVHPHRAVLPQRRREAGPHACGGVQGAGRAVAVGEPVHGAADGDDAGPAGGVGADAAQPVAGGDAVRLAGGAGAAQADVDGPGRRVEVVEEPQLSGRLVDDAGAVGGGVADVERGRAVGAVIGVAAQAPDISTAVEPERVEVAPALVVGEERDAVADQHRRCRGCRRGRRRGGRTPSGASASHQSLPAVPPR